LYFILGAAAAISRWLGEIEDWHPHTRTMGILLAAISVQMIVEGITGFVPVLGGG